LHKAGIFQLQQRKLFIQEMEEYANAAEVPTDWNMTTSHPFHVAVAAMLLTYSCFACHVIAANRIVVSVKFMIKQ
jgi:hypothetical protein